MPLEIGYTREGGGQFDDSTSIVPGLHCQLCFRLFICCPLVVEIRTEGYDLTVYYRYIHANSIDK